MSDRIFPSWTQISSFKVPVKESVIEFAKFLDENLYPHCEIYVRPYLNGDKPDLVILSPKAGIRFYQVIDWNPGDYCAKNKVRLIKGRKFNYNELYKSSRPEDQKIVNPFTKVNRHRMNLTQIYVPEIGKRLRSAPSYFNRFVQTGLYFPNYKTEEARRLMSLSTHKCTVIGKDLLQIDRLRDVVPYMDKEEHKYWDRSWSDEIRWWLIPPIHKIEEGVKITLTTEQKRHIKHTPDTHQRLRGVAGSGKTLVLAERAANIASKDKRVLIVTYNITLIHYIINHLKRARRRFDWKSIQIYHFHGFCSAYLRENNIPWPTAVNTKSLLLQIVPNEVIRNKQKGFNKKNRQYDAILIDEGQDFNKLWYDCLCEFLSDNNELLLVIDEKQNLYKRDNQWVDKMTGTKFRGRWRVLKQCFRFPKLTIDKANEFANRFLSNIKSEIEEAQYELKFFTPHIIWKNINEDSDVLPIVVKMVKFLIEEKHLHYEDIILLLPTHKEGWKFVKWFSGVLDYKVNHVFEDEEKQHEHKWAFKMGEEGIKMSTIHSFKGWEIPTVILITPKSGSGFFGSLDQLIYSSITRARTNLIVLNRHQKYFEYGKSWPSEWSDLS